MKKKIIPALTAMLIFLSMANLSAQPWIQQSPYAGGPRTSALGFSIGSYGYITTGFDSASFKRSMYKFDPVANSWTQATSLGGVTGTGLGRDMAVAFVYQTFAYVAAGQGGSPYLKDMWQYNSAGDYWTQKSNFPGTARRGAAAFMINGKGYVCCGQDSLGYKNDMWEYDIITNTWAQKANFIGTARNLAIGFAIGSKGYVGTGTDGTFKNDFYQYDPSSNIWVTKASFPGTPRYSASSMVIGAKGYIACGYDNTLQNTGDIWEYDPATNFWTPKPNFSGTMRSDAVAFSIGAKGYLGTGYDGIVRDDWWVFDPTQTGIDEHEKKFSVSIFPNPIVDESYFTFDASAGNSFTFRLMSIDGKLIRTENFSGNNFTFVRNGLENGVYLYSISSSNNSSSGGKIILVD